MSMDNMGKPIPDSRRDIAYAWLRSIGVGRDDAFSCVQQASHGLENDRPHQAMKAATKFVDRTGAYRLFSYLLVDSEKQSAQSSDPT